MTILKSLKKYFKSNAKEQIHKDWQSTKMYDNIGPTVDEFIDIQNEQRKRDEFIHYVKQMCEQNLNGREDFVEAFEKGIESAYDIIIEDKINLLEDE